MGFSPGDFEAELAGHKMKVHWEAKDRHLVLWFDNELAYIMRLDYDQARIAWRQMETAMYAAGEDEDSK